MGNKILFILGNLIFAALIYFIVFQDLGYQTLRMWDESRNAVSAIEMIKNQNYLIRYYEGAPDMWEVKPPLLVWLQAISMKLFGYNELAVRLPTAFAVVFTVIVLITFFWKEFNRPLIGYISSLVLVTSQGYISDHVARTGDHDALLTLFILNSCLLFYLYLKYAKPKYIYLLSTSLILAVYTKSIVGLFVLPGLVIFALQQKKLSWLLRQKHVYFSAIVFILVVGTYYFCRELLNPGYLKAVWSMELFPRYINDSSAYQFDEAPIYYYVMNLYNNRFDYWIGFLLFTPLLIYKIPENSSFKGITSLNIIMLLSILLIISFGSNKVWYDAPLYPFMAMIVGCGLHWIIVNPMKFLSSKAYKIGIAGIMIVGIFHLPYVAVAKKVYKPETKELELQFGQLFANVKKNHPEVTKFTVLHDKYSSHIEFYKQAWNMEGYEIDVKNSEQEIKRGDTIMYVQWHIYEQKLSHYRLKEIDNFKDTKLVVIN